MKAAIISLFGNFNYGNRLQSYAAQELLRSLGVDSEVVYIEPSKKGFRHFLLSVYYKTPAHRLRGASQRQIGYFFRTEKFDEFNKNYVNLRRFAFPEKISGYDCYVLGSDQVWNPKRYDAVKKELFFLTFTQPEKKVCLSPSFGLSEIPEEWQAYFAEQLATFPMLCAREQAGAEIIRRLTGREAEVLIDPTLMLDASDWMKIAKKPEKADTDRKYVLTYFLGGTPEKAKRDGEEIAGKIGGEVWPLMDPSHPELYVSGPSEFIYLFSKADFIQTDSFHACIFAFLFRKPFLLYAREGEDADMLSRIDTLFTTLDLMRKFDGSDLPNDLFECSYEKGFERLSEERKKLTEFLKKSMHLSD